MRRCILAVVMLFTVCTWANAETRQEQAQQAQRLDKQGKAAEAFYLASQLYFQDDRDVGQWSPSAYVRSENPDRASLFIANPDAVPAEIRSAVLATSFWVLAERKLRDLDERHLSIAGEEYELLKTFEHHADPLAIFDGAKKNPVVAMAKAKLAQVLLVAERKIFLRLPHKTDTVRASYQKLQQQRWLEIWLLVGDLADSGPDISLLACEALVRTDQHPELARKLLAQAGKQKPGSPDYLRLHAELP